MMFAKFVGAVFYSPMRPSSAPLLLSPARSRGKQRGFTLLEVMAALMVASLLAAAALPLMSGRARDRRAQQFSQQIALFYREARTRAMGRGTAHLVRFSTTVNPQGRLDLYEAVQAVGSNGAGNCQNLPLMGVNSCSLVTWVTGAESRLVDSLVEPYGGVNAEVFATFDHDGTAEPTADICFSPGGRSYFRATAGGLFAAFNGVEMVKVRRKVGGNYVDLLERQVFLLPSGATRVETVVLP